MQKGALLYLIGSESSCDWSETYKLNLKNYIYNYILNLVGSSVGKFSIALFLVVTIGLK
jgi:hypothetical protein